MIIRTAALIALLAGQAQAATVYICWQGANGYTMTGRMEFPDHLLQRQLITEADITAFEITGFLDGEPIGSWNLTDRTPGGTWYLRYAPSSRIFPTDAKVPGPFDQGWNADGTATDCGPGGFGFNAGNYAQDFCLDGVWVEPSGVEPATIFRALTEAPASPDCKGTALMSALPPLAPALPAARPDHSPA